MSRLKEIPGRFAIACTARGGSPTVREGADAEYAPPIPYIKLISDLWKVVTDQRVSVGGQGRRNLEIRTPGRLDFQQTAVRIGRMMFPWKQNPGRRITGSTRPRAFFPSDV